MFDSDDPQPQITAAPSDVRPAVPAAVDEIPERAAAGDVPGEASADAKSSPGPETSLSFETALSRLQHIVNHLEEGSLGLEEALRQFEEGIGLLRTCRRILDQTEQRIEILVATDPAGQPVTAPFDATMTYTGPAAESSASPATPKKPGRRKSATKATSEPAASEPPPTEPTTPPDRAFTDGIERSLF